MGDITARLLGEPWNIRGVLLWKILINTNELRDN
jgi:hypothetical protein